jgi:hypothetical protein
VSAKLRPYWLLTCLLVGCDSLSEFRGSFEGRIVSGSFVRSCFEDQLTADLVFDPDQAAGPVEDAGAAERNRITIKSATQVVFDETPLEPIGLLSNDTLADFDFPGQKRLRNFMLVARPDSGPLAGHDALVVVSLLATKRIELRVIGRGDETDELCPGEGEEGATPPTKVREYYGLFRMSRP